MEKRDSTTYLCDLCKWTKFEMELLVLNIFLKIIMLRVSDKTSEILVCLLN